MEKREERGAKRAEKKKIQGCHLPLAGGCIKGSPLPSLDDGVRMLCTNKQCPYAQSFLHNDCYVALEDFLVKRLASIGSARGWTDAQRRANLWDKKGYMLVKKLCRCLCGLGQISRPPPTAVHATAAVTAKKKKKMLPKLNFNGPTTGGGGGSRKHGGGMQNTSSPNATDDEDFDFYAFDCEKYGWTVPTAADGDGDNESELERELGRLAGEEPLCPTKLKLRGIIQRSFEAFGYIEADGLDTNAFFVPSHVDWDSVFRCLGNVPSCRKFPSLKVFRPGMHVVFDCQPQSERSGCRWMATRVWMMPDDHMSQTVLLEESASSSLDSMPFPSSFAPYLRTFSQLLTVPDPMPVYDLWRGSSLYLGEMLLSGHFRPICC